MKQSEFDAHYERHYRALHALLWRILANPQEAEDVMQEAFLRLYQQGHRIEQEKIKPWLYQVATHLGLDALRSRKRRKRWYQQVKEHKAALPPGESSKVDVAVDVRVVLANIPDKQAQLLTLYTEGLSHQELADAMGLKVSSLPQLLLRAKQHFQKEYHKAMEAHTEGTRHAL